MHQHVTAWIVSFADSTMNSFGRNDNPRAHHTHTHRRGKTYKSSVDVPRPILPPKSCARLRIKKLRCSLQLVDRQHYCCAVTSYHTSRAARPLAVCIAMLPHPCAHVQPLHNEMERRVVVGMENYFPHANCCDKSKRRSQRVEKKKLLA